MDLEPPSSNSEVRKFAIVTAYFKEPRSLLERCLRSVQYQTIKADHIVIADGMPQTWLDHEDIRHLKLDRAHADYGNTARGVGALLAVAEDYQGLAFLDADNWLEPDHIEQCLRAAATAPSCDYIIARRNMKRPDETTIPIADEPHTEHVDTNCFFFLPGSFYIIPRFAGIPRALSSVGDRLFYRELLAQPLHNVVLAQSTVNYHCMWESIYHAVAETPPPGAKPNIDQRPLVEWLNSLSAPEKRIVSQRTCLKIA